MRGGENPLLVLTLWLVDPIYDMDRIPKQSQWEACVTTIWPIRGQWWSLSLHLRELGAVPCTRPARPAFSVTGQGRSWTGHTVAGSCFWSFNIPDESPHRLWQRVVSSTIQSCLYVQVYFNKAKQVYTHTNNICTLLISELLDQIIASCFLNISLKWLRERGWRSPVTVTSG